jgi:hypothetical protein
VQDRAGSKASSRPPSASPPGTSRTPATPPKANDPNAPSQSSIQAAADAQAAVMRDAGGAGGGAVPPVPIGMAPIPQKDYHLGLPAHLQASMFQLSAPAVVQQVVRVTVPRLDDMLIKALADNYHCQSHDGTIEWKDCTLQFECMSC